MSAHFNQSRGVTLHVTVLLMDFFTFTKTIIIEPLINQSVKFRWYGAVWLIVLSDISKGFRHLTF